MCYRFVPDVKNEKVEKILNIYICDNSLPYLSSGFLWANWEFPWRKVGVSSLRSPTFQAGKSKSPFRLILMVIRSFCRLDEMILRFDVTPGSGLIVCYNPKTAAEISPPEAIFLRLTLFKGGATLFNKFLCNFVPEFGHDSRRRLGNRSELHCSRLARALQRD